MKSRKRIGIGPAKLRDETKTYTWEGREVRALGADELLQRLKSLFGDYITESEIKDFEMGVVGKKKYSEIWLRIERDKFHALVAEMNRIQPLHLAVASGSDLGDDIQIIYHFSLFYGIRDREIGVHVKVNLPKKDPVIDTITDVFPGALITEREKQEMLGVVVRNIPDPRRCFTSPELPPGFFPWRNDNDPEVEDGLVKDTTKEGL